MTKVIALEKGYYHKIRKPGERFSVPFSDEAIAKSKWLAPADTNLRPKTERRFIPTSRSASMADILKGVPVEDYDEEDEIDTLSQMTVAHNAAENAHARAYGREPQAHRGPGRPPGSKNKPKGDAPPTAEDVSP